MIHDEAIVDIAMEPEHVFAFLADPAKTPVWVSTCLELRPTEPGPLRNGSRLAYTQRRGSHNTTLEGRVADYEPNRQLRFEYWNQEMDVAVSFRISSSPGGARVHETVEITPKGVLMRILTPFIRSATRKGTQGDIQRLKAALERR